MVEQTEASEPAATKAEGEGERAEPVTLRVGTLTELDCTNPFSCAWWWWYTEGYIYESFTLYGPDCELVPVLAKSMELSDDGLTWTIELQEGVSFSDGEPFNAETLKAFWDWYTSVDPGGWYPSGLYTVSSKALDENTFQFTTEIPVGAFDVYDSRFQVPYPAHIWSEFDDETLWDYENVPPIGTGPYVMTEWKPGESFILEAREDYWGGEPPIERVVIQLYSNWDALINALLAGEIDLTDNAMPVQYFDVVDQEPSTTVIARPPGYYYALYFNVAENGSQHPAILDPIVRQAIDMAIDRRQIIDVALFGHGITCPTDWACGPFIEDLQDPSLEVTAFDLEGANALMDDAGYVDNDGDGIRETEDGQPLSLRLYFDVAHPTQFTMAEMISDWLPLIGIEVDLEGFESATLLNSITGERDYDMFILYMVGEVLPQNVDFYFSCWSSEEGEGTFNYSGYCEEEFDELIIQLLEKVDPAERLEALSKVSQKLNEERPFIMIAGENTMQAFRSDRFLFPQDYCPGTQGMWDWYSLLNASVVE